MLLSLGGIASGLFTVAARPKTWARGLLFCVWWVPAVTAAGSILMRDPASFAVGLLCFLVAGVALSAEAVGARRPNVRRRNGRHRTLPKNQTGDYPRAAS